jgi:hypothetical protein
LADYFNYFNYIKNGTNKIEMVRRRVKTNKRIIRMQQNNFNIMLRYKHRKKGLKYNLLVKIRTGRNKQNRWKPCNEYKYYLYRRIGQNMWYCQYSKW